MITATLLTSLIIFVLFLVLHVLVIKLAGLQANIKNMSLIMLGATMPAGIIFDASFEWLATWAVDESASFIVALVFLFTFIWFGYLQYYFLIERSISIRAMIKILQTREQGATEQDLSTENTSIEHILRDRISQMKELQLLEERQELDGANFRNTSRGKMIGGFSHYYRRVLNLSR